MKRQYTPRFQCKEIASVRRVEENVGDARKTNVPSTQKPMKKIGQQKYRANEMAFDWFGTHVFGMQFLVFAVSVLACDRQRIKNTDTHDK